MITGKQRAFLRSAANGIESVCQIGKDGVEPNVLRSIDEALTKRELIKARVLENCELSAREAAQLVCARLGAEPVQVIGRRFVIYRRNPKINTYGI